MGGAGYTESMRLHYVAITSAFAWGLVLNFFLLIVVTISVGFAYGYHARAVSAPLSAQECLTAGGEVRNTAGTTGRCAPNEVDLGDVEGLRCPCICCKQ
jgi:hypothetical protein